MRISKKGAMPIPYIVALVLGITVLAVAAYWLFFSSGQFGNVILEQGCIAKKMAYCSSWKMSNYGTTLPNNVNDFCTTGTPATGETYYAQSCCAFDWAEDGISQTECE